MISNNKKAFLSDGHFTNDDVKYVKKLIQYGAEVTAKVETLAVNDTASDREMLQSVSQAITKGQEMERLFKTFLADRTVISLKMLRDTILEFEQELFVQLGSIILLSRGSESLPSILTGN